MVVHWKRMPANMDALLDIAQRNDLKVVEDNCVSQGTRYRSRMCGALADTAGISFQDGKMTSAGEGGMFLTDNEVYYQRAATLGLYERLRDLPDATYRGVSGFCFGEKYRIVTLTAAIGCVQMRHWDEKLAVRQANDRKLGRTIAGIHGFSVPGVPDYVESPYDRGHIRFNPQELGGIDRESLLEALEAEGARVHSPARKASKIPHTDLPRALHLHPVFAGNDAGTGEILWEVLGPAAKRMTYEAGTLPVTEDAEVPYNIITLPSFTIPTDELITQYKQAFKKVAAQVEALVRR